MTGKPVHVLLIEDNPGDARLLEEMLSGTALRDYHLAHETRLVPALRGIRQRQPDIVLLDLILPDSQGFETFVQVQTRAPNLPIILLTGMDDEDLAMQAVKDGAQDYLVKGRFDSGTLERAMRYAIERKQTEEELRGHRDHLTVEVQKRTAELFVANEELRREVEVRRHAEKQIRSALHEKEILLHELHDRTRNSLQVIASLLDMQGSYTKNAEAKRVLRENQNRVRAMAFAQDLLYQLPGLTAIDLGQYLQNIVDYLAGVYRDRQDRVSVDVRADNIHLDVDSAVACGLITNELVSNALRYAYPDTNSGGIIRVELQAQNDGTCILRISDEGIGLGSDVNLDAPQSLGLRLATMLTQQIEGQIGVDRQAGTAFAITFAVPQTEYPQEVTP